MLNPVFSRAMVSLCIFVFLYNLYLCVFVRVRFFFRGSEEKRTNSKTSLLLLTPDLSLAVMAAALDHGERNGREVPLEGSADARKPQALHHAQAQQLSRPRHEELLRRRTLRWRRVLQRPRLRREEQGALWGLLSAFATFLCGV